MKYSRTQQRPRLSVVQTRTVAMIAASFLSVGAIAIAAPPAQAANWSFTCGGAVPYQYQSITWSTGVPDRCMWAIMQELGRAHGYTGPIDGVMGPNSWRGFQKYLAWAGFGPGAADGIPGPNTYRAMQRFAGPNYSGPIDGVMGPNSWKGVTRSLFAVYYH